MKRRGGLFTCLFLMVSVILVGCGNKKKEAHAAETGKQETILKPASVWKDTSGSYWHKLKIIDETTWEYSDDMNREPVQITVKRQKNYKGLECYKVVDSADVYEFISKPDSLFIVVPYNDNNIQELLFLEVDKKVKMSKAEIVDYGSDLGKYKLQKTSE